MNSELYRLNKASKKRSKIEELLLVDHSDIYFENDKLGDRLNRYLLQLRKDHHRSVILKDNEIKDLQREIESFKAILRTSELGKKLREKAENANSNTPEKPFINSEISEDLDGQLNWQRRFRALTPDADFKYHEKGHKVRIKSSLEIYQEEPIDLPKSRSLSPSSDKGNENLPSEIGNKNFLGPRSHTSVSGFRRRQKLLDNIDTSDFPTEWFTTVVPASDAVLARIRRNKSAPLHLQLRMLRTRKKKEVKQEDEIENIEENSEKSDDNPGMKMICDTPVRPVSMSLRKLKEIANIDNLAEKVPNRYAIVMKERIEKAKVHSDQLETKCRSFVENIKRITEEELEKISGSVKRSSSSNDMYDDARPPS